MKTMYAFAIILASIPYAHAYPVFQGTESEHMISAPMKPPCEAHGGIENFKANYQVHSKVVNIHYFCTDHTVEIRVVPVREPAQYNKFYNLRRISI